MNNPTPSKEASDFPSARDLIETVGVSVKGSQLLISGKFAHEVTDPSLVVLGKLPLDLLDALVAAAIQFDRARREDLYEGFECLYCTKGFQYTPTDDIGKPTRLCDLCEGTGILYRLKEQQP